MNRIRQLRTERGMSQRELAQKIGTSQKAIDYWEKCLADPSAKHIWGLADYFGCSLDYLMGREDDFGNVNVDSNLSEAEKQLIKDFRKLAGNKRSELLSYIAFLLSSNSAR